MHIFVRSPENEMQKQPPLNSRYLVQNNPKWDSNSSKCSQHEFLQTAKLQPAAPKLFVHVKLKHFVTGRHTVPFSCRGCSAQRFPGSINMSPAPLEIPQGSSRGDSGTFFLSNWQKPTWDVLQHLGRSQLCFLFPTGSCQVVLWKTLTGFWWHVQYVFVSAWNKSLKQH